jgi:hypothetical protein
MSNLLVIRIIPQVVVTPDDFAKNYLNPSGAGLGPLQITAFDLSFDSPTDGRNVGNVTLIQPKAGTPSPTSALPPPQPFTPPNYSPDPSSGIIQQYDAVPATATDSAFFELESVATAIIVVPAVKYENLRLTAQWGATQIPINLDYYDVATVPDSTTHDLNGWSPSPSSSPIPDPWAALPPSIYIQIPAASNVTGGIALPLPTDGTPPPFDTLLSATLLSAVQKVLKDDPGAAVTATTNALASAGSSSLQFSAATAGVVRGMTVSGAVGIPAGTTVASIDSTGKVTLSQELSQDVASGAVISFTANLAALSIAQCRNIAYEIVWSQQPPLPTPPDPVEELYTQSAQNTGTLMSGTAPNNFEANRQQFEAQLKSYYAMANTAADRLTNFIYALSAAVANEQQSLLATEILLDFPTNPGLPSGAAVNEAEVVLSAINTIQPPTNFGVPAAYFYALTANMPLQVNSQSAKLGTGYQLPSLLASLTSAINAGTVTDSEKFVTIPAAAINAAQAARRIVALETPVPAGDPLAPLDSFELTTVKDAPSGTTLTFGSAALVQAGMSVNGPGIATGTTVSSVADPVVTLNTPLLGDCKSGSSIVFTPGYSADLISLMQAWLNYPPATPGTPSSQSYQPTDDATNFWPGAASLHSGAFLNLVLCALTQGYIIPPPFSVSLGDMITTKLLPSATVAALAAITDTQWTTFFQNNPTWLPPGTGNLSARISQFIAQVRQFYEAGSGGPVAPFVLVTTGPTAVGGTTLHFAATTAVQAGMSVSGAGVPAGTTVSGSPTATTVTLSSAVVLPGVAPLENITFSVTVTSGTPTNLPLLPGGSKDWLTACLSAYGAFTLGSGFDLSKLTAAAAGPSVFPDDVRAQEWVVEALVTLDALFAIMKPVPLPSSDTPAYAFSVMEALYARGFTSGARITSLSLADFQTALTGTIAYDLAGAIYKSVAPPSPPASPSPGFQPINDGSLTNCIPAPCASPLGPIAYLNELLKVSLLSTCAAPFAQPVSLSTNGDTQSGSSLPFVSTAGLISGMTVTGFNVKDGTTVSSLTSTAANLSQPILADVPNDTSITFTPVPLSAVLAQRRGPIGNLQASCANLETGIPLIDIVNECLEYLGSVPAPATGTVHDTSSDALADYKLCQKETCHEEDEKERCHESALIFGALPEYSTPATPVKANATVTAAAYKNLKTGFSSCCLPYSQALDVSRTYLRHFGSCRFEEMRTFRKCVREFVLDPLNEPAGFQSYVWRFPVRIDIAIEYLGITPEEYLLLFRGDVPRPCAAGNPDRPGREGELPVWELYGFSSPGDRVPSTKIAVKLPEFLSRTCLSYCEFFELWQATQSAGGDQPAFVAFRNGGDREKGAFPQCEPCCLDASWLQFGDAEGSTERGLWQLAIFVRLWRKLKASCCFCYSFAQLRDICDVLKLFSGDPPKLNSDFIRQLAAFQMLRDRFGLELVDPHSKPAAVAIDADRTHLLALWVEPSAATWGWAVRQLCEKIVHHTRRRHKCKERPPEFIDVLSRNLDLLSGLAGFDPASGTDNWHTLPTHTLRFAEILEKISASRFRISEILFLLDAGDESAWDDLFPLQEESEAADLPLDLPDDERKHSLWHLRRELLEAEDRDADAETHDEDSEKRKEEREDWHWRRVESVLQDELGFDPADILALGRHFFPHTLEHSGYQVDAASMRFTSLPSAKITPANWNTPGGGPFQYDPSTEQLWLQVPSPDTSVITQLTRQPALNPDEQAAVQDVYFQPRAMLALFAVLFPDFHSAEHHLIEGREEHERWNYFRRHVALCHRRCHILARHLCGHVAAVTRQEWPESEATALLIVRELLGDENKATTDWESAGTRPKVTWTPAPNGSAFAALLGLVGTGLAAEFKNDSGSVVWQDVCGSLSGFGKTRDRENAAVPTLLPSLGATPTAQEATFAGVRNGFLVRSSDGALLGGAQGFSVTWAGALLVDEEGTYEFWGGAPTPGNEKPEHEPVEGWQWRLVLKRGARSWVLLSHHWPGEEDRRVGSRGLKRGAYEMTIELVRPDPDHPHHQHAGFEVKYAGPDSRGERVVIPNRQLFSILKDKPWGDGIAGLSQGASLYLNRYYTSSFRDIRRTYQRAFKALLFAHRLALFGRGDRQDESELGYILAHGSNFSGVAYSPRAAGFTPHPADLDFNFLPVTDDYHTPPGDLRANPSQTRRQAMFDWLERLFDYTVAREDVVERRERHFWRLFEEASEAPSADPAHLLEHLGVEHRNRAAELRYFQGQAVDVYAVSGSDLEDERWGLRVWHADRWIRDMECHFAVKDIAAARPDLWASDDPASTVGSEKDQSGNANLLKFLSDGCFENGEPTRYREVKCLNDGLRERGREGLLCWLCHMDRVRLPWLPGQFAQAPRDLSDLLLLDVEAGVCETASRIDEAITAVQNFVRRARLHLEPGWTVTHEFAELWDREFTSFHVWQACKRRQIYKENWVEWSDLERARGLEAFRLLEEKLSKPALSVAVPGGVEWWPDQRPPACDPRSLQQREPSMLQMLSTAREGLNLIGTPERDAHPAYLAAVESGGGAGAGASAQESLPYWIEAADRIGTRFCRIAAAGLPPASMQFEPHEKGSEQDCVTCCDECGCHHRARADEYYFWLIPAQIYEPAPVPSLSGASSGPAPDYQNGYQVDFYDTGEKQSAVWQDPSQLPQLLQWQPLPAVRLAWCRMHNGEFQQLRRSPFALRVDSIAKSDLVFLGRTGDSLTFSVPKPNGIAPTGYADPSQPGFRYDLGTDDAVVLPEVVASKAQSGFLGSANLPSYPWFLFFAPGKSLLPLSPFSPSLAIATALRSHCRFEAALAWYREAFDPLQQDCTWIHCQEDDRVRPSGEGSCCDTTAISCDQARNRSVVLHYLETLIEWGDAVKRRGKSPEAYQQARVIFDVAKAILGKMPVTVKLPDPAAVPSVSSFVPAFPPLNPRLMDLCEIVHDRLEAIHACLNSHRMRDGRGNCEESYSGADPVREGWRTQPACCGNETEWCHRRSPYRFSVLIQKAQEHASRLIELEKAFLAASEKNDAEYLASLRAGHERELLALNLAAKEDQWRDADWQIEALQKTKEASQANLTYYNFLIDQALIRGELTYQDLTVASTILRGVGNAIEMGASASNAAGNYMVGAAGFGGSPLVYAQLPPGQPLGSSLASIARTLIALADIASTTAGLELTEAGWERRADEWIHQAQVLTIEIQQIERQILGAQRRRDQFLQELNVHERQIEQSREVQDFLRDKFSAQNLYLFLQRETSALHAKTWDLALSVAHQAQHAFCFERGHDHDFLSNCMWSDLQEGLMAGERLSTALRRMEKAYLDENIRGYELTKQFSLRLHFPREFLRLLTTGCCVIEIPEWMFDFDYPGQYMRRTKNLTITIPCVSGPYTGVHCRVTLLSSIIRMDPRLKAPAHECCCPPAPCCEDCSEHERLAHEYLACPDDPRVVRQYEACQAVATSTGQNDSGMFVMDFNDPRYVPFEYRGAVCKLRVELPRDNNYFDMDTVTDLMVRQAFTSREGGEPLRQAASAAARRHLPGDGWRFLDVRHEFPDSWRRFADSDRDDRREARLRLRLERKMFPFVPFGEKIWISEILVVFAIEDDDDCACPRTEGCPCPEHGKRSSGLLNFCIRGDDHEREGEIRCVANETFGGLYCGAFDARLGPLGERNHHPEVEFHLHRHFCELKRFYLLCRYLIKRECWESAICEPL